MKNQTDEIKQEIIDPNHDPIDSLYAKVEKGKALALSLMANDQDESFKINHKAVMTNVDTMHDMFESIGEEAGCAMTLCNTPIEKKAEVVGLTGFRLKRLPWTENQWVLLDGTGGEALPRIDINLDFVSPQLVDVLAHTAVERWGQGFDAGQEAGAPS